MAQSVKAVMCPNCNRPIPEGNRFCGFCGTDVEAVARGEVKLTRKQRREAKKMLREHEKAVAQRRKAENRYRGQDVATRIRHERAANDRRRMSQRNARLRAKTVQDAIGFEYIYEDGIACVEDGLYAQTIYVPDINFSAAREDDQDRIWNAMCNFYNSFASDVTIQMTIINKVLDASNRYDEIKLPHTGNPREDHLVDDYNDMLAKQVAKVGKSEIVRQRFFTFSLPAADHDAAAVSLATVVTSAVDQLTHIGSKAHVLSGGEYLSLVGALLRPEDSVDYDYGRLAAQNVDVKDAISPSGIDFTPDGAGGKNDQWKCGASLRILDDGTVSDELWYQPLQFRDPFPAMMDPSIMGSIISLPMPLCLTIQVHPVEQAKAIQKVQKTLTFMKQQEAHEGTEAARKGLDPVVSRTITLTQNLAEGAGVLEGLLNRNERMFTCTMMVTTWARSRARLNEQVFLVAQEAAKRVFHLVTPKYQQRQAFNTMLPFGNDYMAWNRNLLTTEIGTFLPFVTQEISDKGGVFYGNNMLSGNMIILNRKRLAAPMGWIMGKPGSGKSFAAKQEIFDTAIAHPNDDIFIIDPKGEYTFMTECLGGQVIDMAAGGRCHLNPFDITDSYSPDSNDPIIFKSTFITSLIASLIGESSMTPQMLSLIDRTVRQAYAAMEADARRKGRSKPDMPTLTTFYACLKAVSDLDETASELMKMIEIYVTGSLNVFAFPTDVNIGARIVDFNMMHLQYDLRMLGQLVAVDAVWNRTTANHEAGKRTWIYIDEAQNFFNSRSTLEYFTKYWAEGRSYGLIPTGITQNADRIIHHNEAKHMFSNSEFVELLSQAPNDLMDIQALFGLSDNQAAHIRNSLPGQGILIAGGAVIPFRNEFPRDSALYDIMDTDPNAAEDKRRSAGLGA